jgi:hypothetical protein
MKLPITYFEKGTLRVEDDSCICYHHPSFWYGTYRFVNNGVKFGVYSTRLTPSVYRDLIEHFVKTQQFQRLKKFQVFISYSKSYNGREGLV